MNTAMEIEGLFLALKGQNVKSQKSEPQIMRFYYNFFIIIGYMYNGM